MSIMVPIYVKMSDKIVLGVVMGFVYMFCNTFMIPAKKYFLVNKNIERTLNVSIQVQYLQKSL